MIQHETHEQIHENTPDRLKAYAGLLGDVSMLIDEIEASHLETDDADMETYVPFHTFSFELIGAHSVEIPKEILKVAPDIDHIEISIGQDEPNAPTYISVDLISETKAVLLSRSGNPEDEPEFDQVIDLSHNQEDELRSTSLRDILRTETDEAFAKRIVPMHKVPQEAFNRLVGSLLYPNAQKDYGAFGYANFHDHAAFDSLKESLQLAALNNVNSAMYTFARSDASFSYMKADGQPTSFTLRYPQENTGRTIVAHSNLETDFRLRFNTYETVTHALHSPDGTRITDVAISEGVPFYPSTEELTYVRELIGEEITVNTPAAPFDETVLIDENTPEKKFADSGMEDMIFSEEYIQNRLAQLDGDEPGSEEK